MDMTMIDISDSDIIIGDEVEVFGKDILLKDFSELCRTSPYEALARISSRIKRIQF
jgi:alanine racemase